MLLLACAALPCLGCDVTIARGLSQHEAKAIGAALNQRGIAVNTTSDPSSESSFRLAIADNAVAQAVEALREHDAPATQTEATSEAVMPLIPTRTAERRAREAELARQLERALERMPGISRATVQLSLGAEASSLRVLGRPAEARNELATPPSASVALVHTQAALDLQPIRSWLAASVPGLTPARIAILEQQQPAPDATCAELSHIGDVTVTTASLTTLKLWLCTSLGVHILCALALLFVLHRRSSRSGRSTPPAG